MKSEALAVCFPAGISNQTAAMTTAAAIGATMMASCQRRLRALSRASPLGGALTMGGGGVAPAAGGMPAPRGDNTGCIAAGRASCGGRGFMESLSGLQISDFRFWIDVYKSEIGNRQSEISCCFVYE